jgi:hypothetical protein
MRGTDDMYNAAVAQWNRAFEDNVRSLALTQLVVVQFKKVGQSRNIERFLSDVVWNWCEANRNDPLVMRSICKITSQLPNDHVYRQQLRTWLDSNLDDAIKKKIRIALEYNWEIIYASEDVRPRGITIHVDIEPLDLTAKD